MGTTRMGATPSPTRSATRRCGCTGTTTCTWPAARCSRLAVPPTRRSPWRRCRSGLATHLREQGGVRCDAISRRAVPRWDVRAAVARHARPGHIRDSRTAAGPRHERRIPVPARARVAWTMRRCRAASSTTRAGSSPPSRSRRPQGCAPRDAALRGQHRRERTDRARPPRLKLRTVARRFPFSTAATRRAGADALDAAAATPWRDHDACTCTGRSADPRGVRWVLHHEGGAHDDPGEDRPAGHGHAGHVRARGRPAEPGHDLPGDAARPAGQEHHPARTDRCATGRATTAWLRASTVSERASCCASIARRRARAASSRRQ